MDSDYVIIGGGIVGLSIAWGLVSRGRAVTVLDGDDDDHRASRGNFGLVWVQGKGLHEPCYARWSQRSAAQWADFSAALTEGSGIELSLQQRGGLDLCFSEQALEKTVADYGLLKSQLDGEYPFCVLDAGALKKEEPAIGEAVVGAILHDQDGHVNPLGLLYSLSANVRRLGGRIETGKIVNSVGKSGDFTAECRDGSQYRASKVVLAAGLGAIELGPRMGFAAKIKPQRGQVLITEKLPPMINRPSLIARQVDEGGIQIGATNENVGFDDAVTPNGLRDLASDAIAAYPALARAQLVRSWGALRIMSADGLPIYQESAQMPGAFMVTCHSGVTLAAAHACFLPDWLEKTASAPDLEVFGENRFSVS